MKKNVYIVTCFAVLLLIPPIILMMIGWNWSPENQPKSMKWILWLTDTAGAPYSIITSVIFVSITLFVFRSQRHLFVKLIAIMIFCILAMQGLKSILKSYFQEPRPYIVWIEQQYDISNSEFYDLTRLQRAELVQTTVNQNENVPKWQLAHWQSETGYSFPSGHMLFAAGWALLLIGLLWQRRQYTFCLFLAIWAEGIGFSRMILGMHWPIDIIVSIIISGCFAIFGYALFDYKLSNKMVDRDCN